MIIKRYEAINTKKALADIMKEYGEQAFVLSNSRIDNKNVVFYSVNNNAKKEPVKVRNSKNASLVFPSKQSEKVDVAEFFKLNNSPQNQLSLDEKQLFNHSRHEGLELATSPSLSDQVMSIDQLSQKVDELFSLVNGVEKRQRELISKQSDVISRLLELNFPTTVADKSQGITDKKILKVNIMKKSAETTGNLRRA